MNAVGLNLITKLRNHLLRQVMLDSKLLRQRIRVRVREDCQGELLIADDDLHVEALDFVVLAALPSRARLLVNFVETGPLNADGAHVIGASNGVSQCVELAGIQEVKLLLHSLTHGSDRLFGRR